MVDSDADTFFDPERCNTNAVSAFAGPTPPTGSPPSSKQMFSIPPLAVRDIHHRRRSARLAVGIREEGHLRLRDDIQHRPRKAVSARLQLIDLRLPASSIGSFNTSCVHPRSGGSVLVLVAEAGNARSYCVIQGGSRRIRHRQRLRRSRRI